jgi:hypothetical protein
VASVELEGVKTADWQASFAPWELRSEHCAAQEVASVTGMGLPTRSWLVSPVLQYTE